jgi:hypothetical protein
MTPTTTAAPTTATAATSRTLLIQLLLRPVPTSLRPTTRLGVIGGIVVGAAMIAATAVIHLHLWMIGYKHIHFIGPAFLFQAISGLALAVLLVAFRRFVLVVAGLLFCAGSVLALLLSATVGFLGLHDGLGVPWAGWSLGTELAGFVVLTGCAGLMLLRRG